MSTTPLMPIMPEAFLALTSATITTLALVAAAIIVAMWAIAIYNRLVTLRNRFRNAFAQIDVQLKRRYDLIPNLVETAKGYLSHERETLEAVIAARNQAVSAERKASAAPEDAGAMRSLASAEGALGGALGRLMVVVEQYPDLKANQNMMQLSEELTSTENKVAFARQAFNDAVNGYKIYRESFPPIMLAGLLGFGDAAFFEIESPQEREAPKVSFSR